MWCFSISRPPKQARRELLDVIRAAPSRPLAVLIGPAPMKTREVLTDGLEVDSALAKPIDLKETRDLIDRCIRARLPKRVLIVDDSSTVRSVIRKVLLASRFQLETEEAEDGAVAIRCQAEAVRHRVPGLRDARRRWLHRTWRIQTHASGMEVVMMTGTRDVRIEDRARAGGAKDFLYKPFFAKDIDAVLNRLFGLALQ